MTPSPARFALPALLALAACGPPPPRVQEPAAPAQNDPAFTVTGLRSWYLVGNAATPGDDQLTVEVAAPPAVEFIDLWVAGKPGTRLSRQGHAFTATVSLADVPAGTWGVLLAADGATTAFASATLRRSHPYYLLMSTDWDFSEPSQQVLDRQDQLHSRHPRLKLTHFVGPYTFTDPAVSDARRGELSAWLTRQRDTFGDELGLHIHPYCNFVRAAGLACITNQSVVYPNGDASGYTIKVSAYGEADFATLLDHAATLFAAHGLGRPTTFRAGAWTASIETLRALASRGYVADTSALNWARMEEWKGIGNGEIYNWNSTHWAPINDTSQPWWPNHDDVLASAEPTLTLLEVPDNGIMVDYVTVDEMKAIFAENWDGASPLAKPTTLMVGFHPSPSFGDAEQARVDGILDHADQFLAADDRGPVVYVTLAQVPAAFPK